MKQIRKADEKNSSFKLFLKKKKKDKKKKKT